jgi:hypothetical protein
MSTELVKILTDEEKIEFTESLEKYVEDSLYSVQHDKYFKFPQENKVAFLQVTRKAWQKTRELGSIKNKDTGQWEKQTIQYIPVRKIERLLNFLFNFAWESEVIKEDFVVVETKTNKGKETKMYDAFVIMKFSANFLGRDIKRTVCGSFKMYENNAVSRFAVIQACISQAKRNFAKEFGIGADLNDEDLTAEKRFATKQDKEPTDSADLESNLNNNFK